MTPEQQHQWLVCAESPAYFIDSLVYTHDATQRAWVPFHLWPAQYRVVQALHTNNLVVLLKARQLGMTAVVLAYTLWLLLFRPGATVLIFSRRDDEAVDLLDFRLKGMYQRLPEWLQATATVEASNDHEWGLRCGSRALAFPTTAGDSYTATLAVVDEADLIDNLDKLMGAVKPTIDAGGKMVLLSRVDKAKPQSTFKTIYRSAKAGENDWTPIFLAWYARPDRDQAWYEAQRRDSVARTGALDSVFEQYPSSDDEALAPRSLDKRIPFAWIQQCYDERPGARDALGIPGLTLYQEPIVTLAYVCGADAAEGNPTSDDSAATWVRADTGEEVAKLRGKFQPSTFAAHIAAVCAYYNRAPVLPERNNHGHAVILWLRDHTDTDVLNGPDDRPGWLSNSRGKTLMYAAVADALRDRQATIHSADTMEQLASIEGSSLLAPNGQLDDLADSFALACVARGSGVEATVSASPLSGYRGG